MTNDEFIGVACCVSLKALSLFFFYLGFRVSFRDL